MAPYRQNGRTLLGRHFLLAACVMMFSVTTWAQSGKKVFQFVELPTSARIGALGGVPQAIAEADGWGEYYIMYYCRPFSFFIPKA